MTSIMTVPNTGAFRAFGAWLKELSASRRIGVIRTAEGEDLVVVRPEQIAELDLILSDPAFAAALESGVADVKARRVKRAARGLTLKESATGAMPTDASMAKAVESGVRDVMVGKVSKLKKKQTLRDAAAMKR